MDDSANTPPELQGEYGRTLLATRVAGTASVLLAAVWCAWQHHVLRAGKVALEAITAFAIRGPSAPTGMQHLVFEYESAIAAAAALCSLACLVWIWMGGRRISPVIYATTAGTAAPLLSAWLFNLAWGLPLTGGLTIGP